MNAIRRFSQTHTLGHIFIFLIAWGSGRLETDLAQLTRKLHAADYRRLIRAQLFKALKLLSQEQVITLSSTGKVLHDTLKTHGEERV